MPKPEYFRSSLKSKEDLSFLRYRDEQNQRMDNKVRETINRPDYNYASHTTKHEEKLQNNFFKVDE